MIHAPSQANNTPAAARLQTAPTCAVKVRGSLPLFARQVRDSLRSDIPHVFKAAAAACAVPWPILLYGALLAIFFHWQLVQNKQRLAETDKFALHVIWLRAAFEAFKTSALAGILAYMTIFRYFVRQRPPPTSAQHH